MVEERGDTIVVTRAIVWNEQLVDCVVTNADSWEGSDVTIGEAGAFNITGVRVFDPEIESTCPASIGCIPAEYDRAMHLRLDGTSLSGDIGIGIGLAAAIASGILLIIWRRTARSRDSDQDDDSQNVSLELLYPVGISPNVFTAGWRFGARCIVDPGGPNQQSMSADVQWSGTGAFAPPRSVTRAFPPSPLRDRTRSPCRSRSTGN